MHTPAVHAVNVGEYIRREAIKQMLLFRQKYAKLRDPPDGAGEKHGQKTRRQEPTPDFVQTMGQLERDEFRATLIALLSESQGIGFAAEASLRQIVGPETAERVAATSVAQADRVIAWRRWSAQNQ